MPDSLASVLSRAIRYLRQSWRGRFLSRWRGQGPVAQPMQPRFAIASMDTHRVILGYLSDLPRIVFMSFHFSPCAVGTEPTAEAAK